MQPKEVQNFVKMLSVLFDEDKRKEIVDDLVSKAERAEDAMSALSVRESALQEREQNVTNMYNEAQDKLVLCESHRIDTAKERTALEALAMELATVEGAQGNRAVDAQNRDQELAARGQNLKVRERELDEREAQIASKEQELDAKTAIVNAQMAKIAAIQEQ